MNLVDRLAGLPIEVFGGEVFRATRVSLDPLAFSTRGGRWMPAGEVAVLYTSLTEEGALAEIAFHWSRLTPLPSKPVRLHRLRVATERTLRLVRTDLPGLGVDMERYEEIAYAGTQAVGAAVAFLGCDGLIVPSARWDGDHLVLFEDHQDPAGVLEVVDHYDVDWLAWARSHGFVNPPATDD